MSENFVIFLIGGICTFFINVVVFSFKLGSFRETLKNQITEEIYPRLERIDQALNQIENSFIELNAKLEMQEQKCDHDFATVNERITNLKINAQSKFSRLNSTVNELINFVNRHEERKFIQRSHETIPPQEIDDEWTQIKMK